MRLRSSDVAIVVALFVGGCASARAMRAPVSDCSLDCNDHRASSEERILCLKTCSGAAYSERPCDPDERAETVCVTEDLDEQRRRDDPHGVGELIGIVLGLAAGVALVVLAGTSR